MADLFALRAQVDGLLLYAVAVAQEMTSGTVSPAQAEVIVTAVADLPRQTPAAGRGRESTPCTTHHTANER